MERGAASASHRWSEVDFHPAEKLIAVYQLPGATSGVSWLAFLARVGVGPATEIPASHPQYLQQDYYLASPSQERYC